MNEIDVDTAQARMAEADTVMLDVREPHEWAAGRVPGARHVPLGSLTQDALDAGTTYMVMCRSGRRSMQAVQAMIAAGYQAVNIAGGMLEWAQEQLPMEADKGGTPMVISP